MWSTDAGQDGGGNEFPPDEINLIEAGRHYGYPFFVGRNQPNSRAGIEGRDAGGDRGRRHSARARLPAHVTGIDLRFYQGTQFPAVVSERAVRFAARHLHDSREGRLQGGPRDREGRGARGLEDFITGWVKDGVVPGRPAGLATGRDGSLYVSDDNKGFIYRISYGGK